MTTITPNYYNKFKCIADKCKHSCCIGWEIDIDDITLEKYKNLQSDFASKIKSNIEFGDTPHFKLDNNERCPFLNKQGLCDIIVNLGEDMLCQICSDHPRFRNFYDDFVEIGLGLACEAAAKIILTQKEKTTLNIPAKIKQIPTINFREKLFDILQDRTLPLDKRIDNMLCLVDGQLQTNTDWHQVFSGLEKLDNAWDEYLLRIKNGIDSSTPDNSLDTSYEQLLVYLIFRHFLDGQYDDMFKERVLFAVLIYKVIKTMNISNTIEELIEIARIYSSEIEYSDENINTLLSILS
ncbi:MAG: hypothetical protein E7521_02170 [Ruminococcaceae bacterium]|nr:hypothetical protein [Oscillospiraceae bacterium]